MYNKCKQDVAMLKKRTVMTPEQDPICKLLSWVNHANEQHECIPVQSGATNIPSVNI